MVNASMKNSPDKLIIIYLAYGSAHIQSGISVLKDIALRMFPGTKLQILIVDNSQQNIFSRHDEITTISGDNSLWEFSGWDHGITYAEKELNPDSSTIYLFANDTFHRRQYRDGPNFLDVFNKELIEGKDVLTSAIGYLDDFPKQVSLNKIKYSTWIRSNIFFLPRKTTIDLYPLTAKFDDNVLFSDQPEQFWSTSDLLSDNWKAYISSWLFGRSSESYPEYKLQWIKAQPVTNENFEFFKKKARCIISEHFLTARLHQMKIPIIDTNIFEKADNRHLRNYYI